MMEEQPPFEEQQPVPDPPPVQLPFTIPQRQSLTMGYFGQLSLLLILTGVGLIMGTVVGLILFKILTGAAIWGPEALQALNNPAYANANKLMQVVVSIIAFFMPAYFLSLIVYRKPLHHLGFNGRVNIKQIGLVIAITCAGLLLSSALSELNEIIPISKHLQTTFRKMEDDYSDGILVMANMKNFGDYLITVFVIALLPAIVEETFFRGGVQQLLVAWFKKPWIAIVVTSVLFSAIHVSYYGFLPRAALGVMLGLLFYYSKSIWLNILAHFLNNAIAVTQLYLVARSGKLTKEAMNAMDSNFPLWMGLIVVPLIISLFILFKRESDKVIATTTEPENSLA